MKPYYYTIWSLSFSLSLLSCCGSQSVLFLVFLFVSSSFSGNPCDPLVTVQFFHHLQRFSKGYRMYMDIRAQRKNRHCPPLSHRHLATWVESPFFLLMDPSLFFSWKSCWSILWYLVTGPWI